MSELFINKILNGFTVLKNRENYKTISIECKTHLHSCPECYEKWECKDICTIEPDLEDLVCHPNKEFGSHTICHECEKFKVPLTQEWFLIYNGFIK